MWSTSATPPGHTLRLVLSDSRVLAVTMLHSVVLAVAIFYFIQDGDPHSGMIIAGALAVWSAIRLATRRIGARWSIADLIVVAAFLVSTPLLVTSTSFTTNANAMLSVAGTTVIAFGVAYPPCWSAPALVVVMVAWSIGVMRVPGAGPPWSMFSLDFVAVEWALVTICRTLVIRAAVVTDDLLDAAADAEVTRLVSIARHRYARRQCAVMHDTAASTLLMVGTGSVANHDLLRAQVDRDLSTISAFSSPARTPVEQTDLVVQLRSLCEHTTTPTLLSGTDDLPLDLDVVDAVCGATREALINIDRHARATAATVQVTPHSVTIADNGIGIDPESERIGQRYGIRNSIRARLEDVGGHATITGTPRAGTTISLRWDVVEPSGDRMDLAAGVELSRRLQLGFGYGLTIVAAVIVATQSPQAAGATDHRLSEIAIMVAALACTAIAGIGVAHRLPPAIIWSAYAVLVVLVPIQQTLVPTHDLTAGVDWAYGALGWVVVALIYQQPVRMAACALGVYWAVGSISLVVLSPSREVLAMVGFNSAGIGVVQAVVLVFSIYLTRAATTAKLVQDAHVDDLAIEASEQAVADDITARYSELGRTLVPLLCRLRDPATDPADPDIRLAAIIEDARLRRLFAQTDNQQHPLLQEIRPAIAAAEERGVSVTAEVGTPLPPLKPDTLDNLVAFVTMTLDGAASRARIVFSATPESVSASIVGDCRADAREQIETSLGIAPATADDLTWIEMELPLSEKSSSAAM